MAMVVLEIYETCKRKMEKLCSVPQEAMDQEVVVVAMVEEDSKECSNIQVGILQINVVHEDNTTVH